MFLHTINTTIKVEKTLNNSVTCLICQNDYTNIITDSESGEVVCSNCGIVITEKSENISNPEWRAFTADEQNKRARTGAPTSLVIHDRGLATLISKTGRDASGQKLDTAMYSAYKRLRLWDCRIIHQGWQNNSLEFGIKYSVPL